MPRRRQAHSRVQGRPRCTQVGGHVAHRWEVVSDQRRPQAVEEAADGVSGWRACLGSVAGHTQGCRARGLGGDRTRRWPGSGESGLRRRPGHRQRSRVGGSLPGDRAEVREVWTRTRGSPGRGRTRRRKEQLWGQWRVKGERCRNRPRREARWGLKSVSWSEGRKSFHVWKALVVCGVELRWSGSKRLACAGVGPHQLPGWLLRDGGGPPSDGHPSFLRSPLTPPPRRALARVARSVGCSCASLTLRPLTRELPFVGRMTVVMWASVPGRQRPYHGTAVFPASGAPPNPNLERETWALRCQRGRLKSQAPKGRAGSA